MPFAGQFFHTCLVLVSLILRSVNEYLEVTLEGTSTGRTLIKASLKLKCFIQFKDTSFLLKVLQTLVATFSKFS